MKLKVYLKTMVWGLIDCWLSIKHSLINYGDFPVPRTADMVPEWISSHLPTNHFTHVFWIMESNFLKSTIIIFFKWELLLMMTFTIIYILRPVYINSDMVRLKFLTLSNIRGTSTLILGERLHSLKLWDSKEGNLN